jgi:hypothetical protein
LVFLTCLGFPHFEHLTIIFHFSILFVQKWFYSHLHKNSKFPSHIPKEVCYAHGMVKEIIWGLSFYLHHQFPSKMWVSHILYLHHHYNQQNVSSNSIPYSLFPLHLTMSLSLSFLLFYLPSYSSSLYLLSTMLMSC